MFGAIQFLNVLLIKLLCVPIFYSVKVAELPPIWERAAKSAYQLLEHALGCDSARFCSVFTSFICP